MNTITGHPLMKLEDYTCIDKPSQEAWEWYTNNKNGDVHIFEETYLEEYIKYNNKIKIAVLQEVPTIYDYAKKCDPNSSWMHPYIWIKNNHQHFNYIMSPFTFLKDIIGKEKYIWAACQASHIQKEDYGLYNKERLLSIIVSHKKWTIGHQMRHKIIEKYKKYIDIYGSGYNNIINDYNERHMGKIIALAPYFFTIIIPNTNIDDWYSDQVTDAMVVGTIPIFCGTKNIGKYFNINGIIQFNTIEELGKIIPTLSEELYQSKMNAILENFEKAKHHESTADWLYYNKKEFLENIK